ACRAFTEAMISCAWTLPFSSIKQIMKTLASYTASQPIGTTVTVHTSRCTPAEPFSDLIEWAFRTADQLQRDVVDLMLSCLSLAPLTPRRLMKMTFDTVQQSAEAFGLVIPGRDIRLSWQEFKNKLQAFNAFTHADLVLNLPAGTHYPLTALVE